MPYINGSRKCQNVVGWAYFWCIYRAIWFVKWGDLLTMTFYIEMTFQFQIYGCFTIKPIVLPLKNWLTVQNTGTKTHGVVPNITYLWTNNCSELPHWSGFTLYSTGCMHRRHGTRIRVSAIINCMVQYDYTELHYCVCACVIGVRGPVALTPSMESNDPSITNWWQQHLSGLWFRSCSGCWWKKLTKIKLFMQTLVNQKNDILRIHVHFAALKVSNCARGLEKTTGYKSLPRTSITALSKTEAASSSVRWSKFSWLSCGIRKPTLSSICFCPSLGLSVSKPAAVCFKNTRTTGNLLKS